MPAKRRPRRVKPSIYSCSGFIALFAISLILQSSQNSKSPIFAEAFGIPIDQSSEFLTLLSAPTEAWLLPLVAPPLSSLLSSASASNTPTSWSSLALPADLSIVCDNADDCHIMDEEEEVNRSSSRPIIEEFLGNIAVKSTMATVRSTVADVAMSKQQESRIQLTAEEQQLFQLLVEFRNECCPATRIRVAGGWVRDKLLANQRDADDVAQHKPSKDIDLVTSNISGQAFAHLLRGYLMNRKVSNGLFGSEGSSLGDDLEFYFPQLTYSKAEGLTGHDFLPATSESGAPKSNPLQTANFQIGGFDIDVCHLRKDLYDGSSRVPTQTQLASPAEDSWRRDLTINSLFYNLHSNQIEDWTEQGLEDLLSQRRIATPKAPLPTLLQDPLRILRAIRFAAQFSFTMDPKLIKAARNRQVQAAINAKLSQSRRAKEMDAIFRTSNPSLGIGFLLDTNLLSALLPTPKQALKKNGDKGVENWEQGFLVLLYTQRLASQVFVRSGDWKEVHRRFLWYAALLQPFYGHKLQDVGTTKSKRSKSPLFDLLNSKLKISKSDVQSIESILKGLNVVTELLHIESNHISNGGMDGEYERKQAERLAYYEALVRVGPLWKEAAILYLAIHCQNGEMSVEKAISKFRKLQSKIRNLGFEYDGNYDNIFGLHPLLTGSDLMHDTLPRLSQGRVFKEVMEEQKRWQVCHLDMIGSQEQSSNSTARDIMMLELRDYLRRRFPDYA